MEIKENIPLKTHTTFRIGGPARYFANVATVDEIRRAVSFAKERRLPFFVLGGGSNVLLPDEGFPGVVIKIELKGRAVENLDDDTVRYVAQAGENWDDVVSDTVSKNLWGLENLSNIPGTVGAAPIQNIGAYGRQVSDVIEYVDILDTESMKTIRLSKDECGFSYRESVFKKSDGKKLIVLGVSFFLGRVSNPVLSYHGLRHFESYGTEELSPGQIRDAVISLRKEKLPDINIIGTAGSFFKNPLVSKEKLDELKKIEPEIVYNPDQDGNFKLSGAYLLDAIGGWKGFRAGDAGVYDKHALVLVNYGNASARDIVALKEMIINDMRKKTGITFEPEVEIV